MADKPLSARAKKTLRLLHDGRPYPAYHDRTPQSMTELRQAGLVRTGMRCPLYESHFVPKSHFSVNLEVNPPAPGTVDPAIERVIIDYILEMRAAAGAIGRKIDAVNALKTAHRIIGE